jgi:hypothetical protein
MAGRSQMLRLPAYQAMTGTARIASSGFIPPCLPTKVDRPADRQAVGSCALRRDHS